MQLGPLTFLQDAAAHATSKKPVRSHLASAADMVGSSPAREKVGTVGAHNCAAALAAEQQLVATHADGRPLLACGTTKVVTADARLHDANLEATQPAGQICLLLLAASDGSTLLDWQHVLR